MEQIVTFKYQCMGNDYLVYDPNRNPTVLSPSGIARLCDRHFGIGADGVLVGPYLDREKMYVRIYNADGSEAEFRISRSLWNQLRTGMRGALISQGTRFKDFTPF